MTAAIGHKFFAATVNRSASDARNSPSRTDDSTAFGELVGGAGKRHTRSESRGAAPVSGDDHPMPDAEASDNAGPASPLDDAGMKKTDRHPHKADRSTDDDEGDEQSPVTKTDDASPSHDRMPLLVTLQAFGQRHAADTSEPSSKAGDAPTSRTNAKNSAPADLGKIAVTLHTSGHDAPNVAGLFDIEGAAAGKAGQDVAGATAESVGESRPARASGNSGQMTSPDASQTAPQAPRAEQASRMAATVAASNLAPGRTAARGTPSVGDAETTSTRPGSESHGARAAPELGDNGRGGALPLQAEAGTGDDSDADPRRTQSRMSDDHRSAAEATAERRTNPDGKPTGPVTVTADRSFPAPAAHTLHPTTAMVLDALAAASNRPAAHPVPVTQPLATVALPAQLLRIELHPAELGAVVANLRMSGEQLSVELKPETAEAYRRLSSDSEAIAKSLKKLGLDVDTVTVIQPVIATTPAARADTGNQASLMPGRDASQFQPGTSGNGGDNFGGQQSGRNRGHDGQALDRPSPVYRERSGDSLFI